MTPERLAEITKLANMGEVGEYRPLFPSSTVLELLAENATLRSRLDALVTAGEKDGVLTMSTILARIQDYFNPEIPRELSEKHLKDVVGFGWKRHDSLSTAVAAANFAKKEGV